MIDVTLPPPKSFGNLTKPPPKKMETKAKISHNIYLFINFNATSFAKSKFVPLLCGWDIS
jgi:hypothetical protein